MRLAEAGPDRISFDLWSLSNSANLELWNYAEPINVFRLRDQAATRKTRAILAMSHKFHPTCFTLVSCIRNGPESAGLRSL